MSRFTDLFQEPAPAPVVEQPVVEEVKEEPKVVHVEPVKETKPKRKFSLG